LVRAALRLPAFDKPRREEVPDDPDLDVAAPRRRLRTVSTSPFDPFVLLVGAR
jgi:hypothetical protein